MVLPQAMAWVQYWFRVLRLKFYGKSKKNCGDISQQSPAFCMYDSTVFEDPKVLSTGIIVFDHQKLSKPFGVFMFLFQNGVAEGGDWKTLDNSCWWSKKAKWNYGLLIKGKYRIIPPYLVLLEYEYYSFFCPQFVLIGQEIFHLSFLAALSQGHDFGNFWCDLGTFWSDFRMQNHSVL